MLTVKCSGGNPLSLIGKPCLHHTSRAHFINTSRAFGDWWSCVGYNIKLALLFLFQLPWWSRQRGTSCNGGCGSALFATMSWSWAFCALCGEGNLVTSHFSWRFRIYELLMFLALVIVYLSFLWFFSLIELLYDCWQTETFVDCQISGIWALDSEALFYCVFSLCSFSAAVSITLRTCNHACKVGLPFFAMCCGFFQLNDSPMLEFLSPLF